MSFQAGQAKTFAFLSAVLGLLASPATDAAVNDIVNYRGYTETFASSGQPSEQQLQDAQAAGFERVVYIAFSDHRNSLPREDRIVKNLGLEYVQIPVIWDAPTHGDYEAFAAVMQRNPSKKTLLHCQVNYRASAFAFLYRVLHDGVGVADAKADMNAVWTPNDKWTQFVREVLSTHGISPDCEGCDWTPANL